MANSESVVMTPAQLQEILRTLVSEIRKPPVDPVKEAQKKREQEQKEANNSAMWKRRIEKLLMCSHSREDGTCAIAWAEQSDKIERGFCPYCQNLFGPEMVELEPLMTPAQKEVCPSLKQLYTEQRRRTRGRKESVRYIS